MRLLEYKLLIHAFIERQISVEEFERQFLNAFKSESEGMDMQLFCILDALFGAVDSYWHECLPGQETAFMISEEQLRREAAKALLLINELEGATNV
ncbi:MAG TPA: colicin immunity domain-containing protein [Herpetosiphonaceae bacterium]